MSDRVWTPSLTIAAVPRGSEITCSSSAYTWLLRGVRNRGIPVVLTAALLAVYIGYTSFISEPNPYTYLLFKSLNGIPIEITLLLGTVGQLSFEEVKSIVDVVLKYPRVSSRSQEDNYSLSGQNNRLEDEIDKLDPDRVHTIGDEWESASTMFRKNVSEIIDFVERTDDTVVLMLKSVDRLSRADPLEGCVFLWIMRQNDVILYFDDLGYFDLRALREQLLLVFELMQSRQEYNRIINNGEQGRREAKANNNYPANPPYAYTKNDDDSLSIIPAEAELIQRCAELIIEGDENNDVPSGNVRAAWRQINTEFEDSTTQIPSYSTLLNVVRNELYTGKLLHDGEPVGSCPAILSEETFSKLQQNIPDQTQSDEDEKLDGAFKRVIKQLGVRAALSMFERILKPGCPECGDDVVRWGNDTVWGNTVINYRCSNHPELNNEGNTQEKESTQCDFDGPLLSEKFLRQWQNSVPLICPVCQHHLDDEQWEQSQSKIGAIEQRCGNCETGLSITVDENKFKRTSEVPSHQLRFFEQSNDQAEKPDGGDVTCEQNTHQSETNKSILEYN